MWTDEVSDLFYERISVKALKQEFISNPALSRTQKHSHYKLLDSYFQLDGPSTDIFRIYQRMISE